LDFMTIEKFTFEWKFTEIIYTFTDSGGFNIFRILWGVEVFFYLVQDTFFTGLPLAFNRTRTNPYVWWDLFDYRCDKSKAPIKIVLTQDEVPHHQFLGCVEGTDGRFSQDFPWRLIGPGPIPTFDGVYSTIGVINLYPQ
jgi:hypothetical protein